LRLNLPHWNPNRTQASDRPGSGWRLGCAVASALPQSRCRGSRVQSFAPTEAPGWHTPFLRFHTLPHLQLRLRIKVAPRGATPLHVPLSTERPRNLRIATLCYRACRQSGDCASRRAFRSFHCRVRPSIIPGADSGDGYSRPYALFREVKDPS
jgi:hypothetical protein